LGVCLPAFDPPVAGVPPDLCDLLDKSLLLLLLELPTFLNYTSIEKKIVFAA